MPELLLNLRLSGGLLGRHEELVARGNLWEAAHALARAWTDEHGSGDTMPSFDIAGPFWRRWQLRRQVQAVWQLTSSHSQTRVSKRRFLRLAHSLADLTMAIHAGQLQIRKQ